MTYCAIKSKLKLMKVDLENKAELRRKKSELIRWIAVIDLALGETTPNGVSPEKSEASMPTILIPLLDKLDEEFNSSQVYDLIEKSKRPAVKLALKSASKDGLLTITVQGKGRRPTEYRKN